MFSTSILQWNVRGVKNKIDELKLLITQVVPECICLQETKLSLNDELNISGFNSYLKSVEGERSHGGVAILVNSQIPSYGVNLDTNLQAVAISVNLHKKVTVCSIYLPPLDEVSREDILNVIEQLPKPFLLLGDFNAHSNLWYDDRECGRGKTIEKIILENDVALLDKDSYTFFSEAHKSFTHIDLSLCSVDLLTEFEWSVHDDLMGSDHYPILIKSERSQQQLEGRPKWILHKADWAKFRDLVIPKKQIEVFDSIDEGTDYFTSLILDAANRTIPKSKGLLKRLSIPWWNEKCKEAIRKRKSALRKFSRCMSEQNYINYKKLKAEARRIIRQSKRESWQSFISSISSKDNIKQVWQKINLLKHKSISNPLTVLKNGNQMCDNPVDIANCIGQRLAFVSSEASCDARFLEYKHENESQINFGNDDGERFDYNKSLTMVELEAALAQTSDSAPGPDGIHYQMIKNLGNEAKHFLIDLYDMILLIGKVPSMWKLAHIIPILKPGKDPLDVGSYRPIALTSCLCKLFERIINRRLVWYLEKNNKIDKAQSGFRKGRSTIDSLVALETEIHDAFVKKHYLLTVFYDLEKAYDTCWKHLILKELYAMGLRGYLPLVIRDFLQNRKFRVLVGKEMSREYSQDMGVPQGSVLSVTVFSVAINTIIEVINNWLSKSLYVDDFRMAYSHDSLHVAKNRIQSCLNKVYEWTTRTGFRFSQQKTEVMVFTRKRGIYNDPELWLGPTQLRVVKETKFLGMIFDSKLNWIPHLKMLKLKCLKAMNIMKIIAYHNQGTDTKTLMRIYRALIRSKLDYGCQVYGTASPTALKMLDSVHHQALRIATGAFKTSPVESLYIEAHEPSLVDRRKLLQLQYFLRTKKHAVDNKLVVLERGDNDNLYVNSKIHPKSLGYKIRGIVRELGILFPNIDLLREYEVAPWKIPKIEVCLALSLYGKDSTSAEEYLQYFGSHRHESGMEIFTDGSKKEDLVGSAIAIKEKGKYVCKGKRLNGMASIFTAELVAIKMGLVYLKTYNNRSCVFYSDSKSSLQAIDSFNSQNALIREIHILLYSLKLKRVEVIFCWIPAHVGIVGNELADTTAKNCVTSSEISVQNVLEGDVKSYLHRNIYKKWDDCWKDLENNKLREIEPSTCSDVSSYLPNRRDSVKIARLRIGHTYLTHGFLLNNEDRPHCDVCGTALTVKHVLLSCLTYANVRRNYFRIEELNMKAMLSRKENVFNKVIGFLKEVGLYSRI